MPLPPQPTPPGPISRVAASNAPVPSATSSTALLDKLKLLQESLNEVQQQLSDLVDEVSKSNSSSRP